MYTRISTLLRASLALLRRDGMPALMIRVLHWLRGERRYYGGGIVLDSLAAYQRFQHMFEPDNRQLREQRSQASNFDINFAIYCHTGSDEAVAITLDSVRAQTYSQWVWTREGENISQDNWVLEITAGDILAPFALYMLAEAISSDSSVDVLYGDEDRLDHDGQRVAPLFKPGWSPEMMVSYDLLSGVCAFRRRLVSETVLADPELHQHLATCARKLSHIPSILVHRQGVRNTASPKGNYRRASMRSVSIIIPSRDHADLLQMCLRGIFEATDYPDFEVIIVDTGSTSPETTDLYSRYAAKPQFRVVTCEGTFNFSRACNVGAATAKGELLLFLNNDIEVLHSDWLQEMAWWFNREGVGIVGAQLLYPDTRIQHAGIIIGLNGLAAHLFQGIRAGSADDTLFGGSAWVRNLMAVTAACLLISREAFDVVGGYDEGYQLSYSDVQLGISAVEAGYRVVYTPYARLIHHESRSRGRRVPRGDFERANIRWRHWLEVGDPYFNVNLSHRSTFPRARQNDEDNVRTSNAILMARLPQKETLTVPDDLV